METTFVINKDDLNSDFLKSLKSLFKKTEQLQITVTANDDFGLLQKETPAQYIARLKKNIKAVKSKKNQVIITQEELEELVLRNS